MKIKFQKNVPLYSMTTFGVGGNAKFYAQVKDQKDLKEAVSFAKAKGYPIFVIGGGSNVLISDKGFPGLVLRSIDKTLKFYFHTNGVEVSAGAGLNWDDLVEVAVKHNFQGLECLSGIPGTVGAAPVQNIGAYGQELKDSFIGLTAYDTFSDKFVFLDRNDCRFSYRTSIFKDPKNAGRYIIVEVRFRLKKSSPPTLTHDSLLAYLKDKKVDKPSLYDVREAVLNLRRKKLEDPNVAGNAGSFFKNPIVEKEVFLKIKKVHPDVSFYEVGEDKVKLFAGWMIERAGWKGKSYKGASVSKKNALVLINRTGKSTAKDIKSLADKIVADIAKKFDVLLEPEVQYVGF